MRDTIKLAQQGRVTHGRQARTAQLSSRLIEYPYTQGHPMGIFCLGYRILADAKVLIYGGEIQIGSFAPVEVGDKTVTITVDRSRVGWKFVYATKIFSIENFGASLTYNGSSAQKWLYEFRLVNGVVFENRDGSRNPFIPGPYTDLPA